MRLSHSKNLILKRAMVESDKTLAKIQGWNNPLKSKRSQRVVKILMTMITVKQSDRTEIIATYVKTVGTCYVAIIALGLFT